MKKTILIAAMLLPLPCFAASGLAFDGVQGLLFSSAGGGGYDPASKIVEIYPGVWKRITKDGKVDDSTTEVYNGIWVTKSKNRGNTTDFDGAQPQVATRQVGSSSTRPSRLTDNQSLNSGGQSTYTNGSVTVTKSRYGSNIGGGGGQVNDLSDLINN